MSRNLAKLLSVDETSLAMFIAKLEEWSGSPSEDVRLLSENKNRVRQKIGQLGLDADDTTDKELFYALRARYKRDSQMLDKAVGVNEHTKLNERLNKAVQLANHCVSTDDVWVVKNSVAKVALAKYPPKHVIRQLHYRSITSMIKREDCAELYLAGSLLESATWQRKITQHIAKLSASNFELRPIRIINLKPERWQNIKSLDEHIVSDKNTGSVAVWPSDDLGNVSALTITLLLLSGIKTLNPNGYNEAIHELSPALRWWADSAHLISSGPHPVSLNLKDVALNYLRNHNHKEAVRHHGVHSLWSELTGRYQRISESLSDSISTLQMDLNQVGSAKLPSSAELAEEYAKAES